MEYISKKVAAYGQFVLVIYRMNMQFIWTQLAQFLHEIQLKIGLTDRKMFVKMI